MGLRFLELEPRPDGETAGAVDAVEVSVLDDLGVTALMRDGVLSPGRLVLRLGHGEECSTGADRRAHASSRRSIPARRLTGPSRSRHSRAASVRGRKWPGFRQEKSFGPHVGELSFEDHDCLLVLTVMRYRRSHHRQ